MSNLKIHVEVGAISEFKLLSLNSFPPRQQLNLEHGDNCSAVRGKMVQLRTAVLAVRLARLL